MNLPKSVTQTKPFYHSSRYAFVPTTQVIELLGSKGWQPASIQETRVLDEHRQGYQKHLIRFRQEAKSLIKKDQLYPEIVFINGHDSRTAPQLHAGTFRCICSNGLIVADSVVESIHLRHVKNAAELIFTALEQLVESFPRLTQRIEEYRLIDLTPDEQGIFAEAAAAVRWPDDPKKLETLDLATILRPRRVEDEPGTLWHTFQRLQEKLVMGGDTLFNRGRYARRAKPIQAIDEQRRVNVALWQLMEEIANLKAA